VVTTSRETARRLDRDQLVTSALAIADTEGLDAVTIRRLAQEHDVTPMALYRHFSDKDDLLAAVADRLLADVTVPEPTDERWDLQLHALLAAFVAALRPHPTVAGLTLGRLLVAEPGLELCERILELLSESSLSQDLAAEVGRQAVCNLVALVAYQPGAGEENDALAWEDTIRVKRAALGALPPRRYPRITAVADTLVCPFDMDRYYQLGIENAVAGIRGVLDDQSTA
jgi:TetR/AcrR family tetracycline transcriptional repressor